MKMTKLGDVKTFRKQPFRKVVQQEKGQQKGDEWGKVNPKGGKKV